MNKTFDDIYTTLNNLKRNNMNSITQHSINQHSINFASTLTPHSISTSTKRSGQRFMKKTVLATFTCIALTANPLFTQSAMAKSSQVSQSTLEKIQTQTQKEQQLANENVGFGSGLVLGAIVAGPIGAIISGIGGAMIANHNNTVDDVNTLSTALEQEQQERQHIAAAYNQKLQKAEQAYQNELLALEQSHTSAQQIKADNLLMSLQFSTGSSDIAPHY